MRGGTRGEERRGEVERRKATEGRITLGHLAVALSLQCSGRLLYVGVDMSLLSMAGDEGAWSGMIMNGKGQWRAGQGRAEGQRDRQPLAHARPRHNFGQVSKTVTSEHRQVDDILILIRLPGLNIT